MSLKKLAEGIILQSVEDLWNESCREDCIAFFRGEDFTLCAELAGMGLGDQVELLNLIKKSVGSMEFKSRKKSGRERNDAREKKTRQKQIGAVLNYT